MKQFLFRAGIAFTFLVAFGLIALKAVVFPLLQHRVESKAKVWLEKEGLELQYRKIQLTWRGIRIDRVILERDNIRLKSNLEIRWHFVLDERLVALDRIVFDRPHVIAYRKSSGPGSSEFAKKEAIPSRLSAKNFEDVLGRWVNSGTSIEIRRGFLEIFDQNDQKLVDVQSLQMDFDAIQRSAHIVMQDVAVRQNPILAELDGQIILQDDRESFPFVFQARDPGGEPWQLQGQLAHDFNRIEFKHKRSGLPKAWLEKLSFIADPEHLRFLMTLSLDGLLNDNDIRYDLKLTSSNLMLTHPSLGSDDYGPWPFSARAKGLLALDSGSLAINSGLIFLVNSQRREKPIRVEFKGQKANLFAALAQDPFQIQTKLRATSCQSVLEVLPQNLIPMLEDFELAGDFQVAARFELFAPGKIISLDQGFNRFNCRLLRVPEMMTRQWLYDQSNRPTEEFGRNPSMQALKSSTFVSRDRIPDDFFKGVVAAEDSGFWRHRGLRIDSLIAALEANLKAGHVVFGGSTITMQLVKNLYLGRDRVITRKLQELFLAWAIEHTLTKPEILEIYANVIEFAPKAWGIAQGAKVYFGKEPEDLTSAESLFLASILPSPERNFSESYCGARLTKSLSNRMMRVASELTALSREGDFLSNYERDLYQFRFSSSSACREYISRAAPRAERRF